MVHYVGLVQKLASTYSTETYNVSLCFFVKIKMGNCLNLKNLFRCKRATSKAAEASGSSVQGKGFQNTLLFYVDSVR